MISGTEMGHETNDEMMAMGININEQDAQKRLKGFLTRAGWQDLPAVKTTVFTVFIIRLLAH